MSDIVERLRRKKQRVHDLSGVGYELDPECQEAADEISRLWQELREAREVIADICAEYADPHNASEGPAYRKARAFLAKSQ